MKDILIAGQGLAGSILALTLKEAGLRPIIADTTPQYGCSLVAAGLFNPITGKRLSLTWEAVSCWEALYRKYPAWEALLAQKFFHEMPLFRVLHGQDQLNEWSARSKEEPYPYFLAEEALQKHATKGFAYEGLVISKAGCLDTRRFIKAVGEYFTKEHAKYNDEVRLEDINKNGSGGAVWKGQTFDAVVHCGGWRPNDPLLPYDLPFTPMRGEIIDVQAPEFPEHQILVGGQFMLPLGGGLFRVGSTYDGRQPELGETEEGKETLLNFAHKTLGGQITLTAHRSGVRPAVKDRKPMIGSLDKERNLYLFNGFGSKAVSLAPWLAERFRDYLINGKELPKDADVERFL